MPKLKIKKGDQVVILSGDDKGKTGRVLQVLVKANRAIVEGVNIVAKSKKPRNAQDKGGIIKQEGTIDASNVMHVCASCGDVVRVKHEVKDVNGKQKSVRVCPKCGASLDEKKPSAKKVAKKAAKKKAEKSEDKKD